MNDIFTTLFHIKRTIADRFCLQMVISKLYAEFEFEGETGHRAGTNFGIPCVETGVDLQGMGAARRLVKFGKSLLENSRVAFPDELHFPP